jgi:hypothetical protein
MKQAKKLFYIKLFHIIFNILVLLLIYITPLEWIHKQNSICLIKNLFGIECFGCGITRAVISILHFKFIKALDYNVLVVIVFPLIVYYWLRYLNQLIKNIINID